MPGDFGLFVTLLPKGKIKRDLVGPAGKTSLEETSIQDELILFSELSFLPYAQVVDYLRTAVRGLYMNDMGMITNTVNPNVFHFILETATDLANTLMEESPVHGILLWAELEDRLSERHDATENAAHTCSRLLEILEAVMLFQFVVNEVLHDMAEGAPLEPEKYEGLWEMSVTQIVTAGDGISTRYHFRSAVDYYHFLLLHFVADKTRVAFCQCCGRYFIPKTRSKTIYCDRILKDGKTCKHWGPILKHRLEAQDKVIGTFDQVQKRMYKRYERTRDGKQSTEKDLSYEEYYLWQERAAKARDDYLAEKITAEEALKIIDVP